MIASIGLHNFKCFQTLDLPMKPLSLLCGQNGMGKSSVIQALLVIRQSYLSEELTAGRLALRETPNNVAVGDSLAAEA
jgi:predicted ATPase